MIQFEMVWKPITDFLSGFFIGGLIWVAVFLLVKTIKRYKKV